MAIIKDFITRSGVIIQGTAAVTSSTGQTGALQINGGAAIAKNLIVGQSAQIYGTLSLYDQLILNGSTQITGTFTATNGNLSGTLSVGNNATLNSLTVTNASLFNGTITVNGTSTFNAPIILTGSNSLTVGSGQSTFGGVVSITNNQAATIGGNGALRVTGGIYVGSNIVVNSLSANTQTSTDNALYVAGGAWVDKSFVVGGDTIFRGNVTFSGTQTNVYSTNTVYTDNLLSLHVPSGSTGTNHTWTLDDGKDIGFMFHYYKTTDKDGFLGFSNSSGFLEWYEDSTESGTGVVTPTAYGTFKTGAIRLVNSSTSISASSGALQVVGGIGAGNLYTTNDVSGGTVTARNLTNGRVVYAGANGQLVDSGNLTFNGTILTGTITTATNATNLLGGAVGSIPFQTATNTTVFLPIGNAGEILVVSGGKPTWTPATGLSAGQSNTSTNIAGGTAGQVPYQTAPGNTSFFGPGTIGQLLQSNGTSGPLYVNTGNVFVGFSAFSVNVRGGAVGEIPMQTAANTTVFIPAGTNDTFLRHNGTTATFVSTGTIFVGNAVTATNIRAGSAGQLHYQSAPDITAFVNAGNVGEVLVSRGANSSGPLFQNTLTLAGTTTATSTQTGAFQVAGGAGIGGDLYVGQTSNLSGVTRVTNNTAASSPTTGALQVTGGAGVNGDIWVGGNANVARTANFTSSTNATSTTSGAVIITGGAGIGANLWVGGNHNVVGITALLNTTNASSTSTGALQVSGGAGIGQNLWVGGTGNFAGVLTAANSTNATSTTTGALVVTGGAGIGRDLYVGGTIYGAVVGAASTANAVVITNDVSNTATHFLTFVSGTSGTLPVKVDGSELVFIPSSGNLGIGNTNPTTKLDVTGGLRVSGISTITNTTNASSTTTGALQIAGGAGIGQNLFVGGTANISGATTIANATNASSTTTGALIVTGGAGIGQNLFVGGNLNVTGTITGTLTGNAATVSTVERATNSTHFLTFVDSNNAAAGGESVYTTSSFTLNPSNGNVNITGSLTLGSAVTGVTVNAIFSNNVLLSSYTTPALTSTSTVTLDSLSTSTYRSARYTVQVVRGSSVHVTEAVIFHDNTNAYINEYGISTSGGELGIFDANISTNNLLFTFTPSSTASTVVKVVRMALTS